MQPKPTRFQSFKRFLFPLAPVKIFKSTKMITILAVLLALRIVFNLLVFNIPNVKISISFAWLPVMLMGWFFGPVYGFVLGAVTDTVCYFIFSGGVWFWMYSIQEPCVGLIAGIFASVCQIRKSKNGSNIYIDILVQQITFIAFGVAAYTILIVYLTPQTPNGQSAAMISIYKWVALSLITLFFIIMECFSFYYVSNYNKDYERLITFIYGSAVVIVTMLIFSFLLGPITTVEYFKYINNGIPPTNWVEIGAVYYLIPRVIVESIKVPIESSLLVSLVIVLNPILEKTVLNINNRWTHE